MERTETDDSGSGGEAGVGRGIERLAAWIVRIAGHLIGTASVAVLLALPSVNWQTVEMYWTAVQSTSFAPAWSQLGLHVGLSAVAWGLLVAAFHFVRRRLREQSSRSRRIVRADRGSVMVETLIVIVPFLLLTSGLAQLALRNTAGILADLAYYRGTRTAWVWQPEIGESRGGRTITKGDVQRRARVASAAVLAPSAPSSFSVNDTNADELINLREAMYATFDGNPNANIGNALDRGGSAVGVEQSFARAFDEEPFEDRAARKLTFAFLALDQYNFTRDRNGAVSVEFTYEYNVVFPWFAYIFGGGPEIIGGRRGYYVGIQRPRNPNSNRYTLPHQNNL